MERTPAPVAPTLGYTYPSNPNLEYAYPSPTPTVLANITNALIAVPKFYTQVLHLMNKMNLPPPFGSATPTPSLSRKAKRKQKDQVMSDSESEIESDSEDLKKRKRKEEAKQQELSSSSGSLPAPTPTPPVATSPAPAPAPTPTPTSAAAGGSAGSGVVTTPSPSSAPVATTKQQPKAVQFKFNAPGAPAPVEQMEVVSTVVMESPVQYEYPQSTVLSVPLDELSRNRMKPEELNQVPAFKKYTRGTPSPRLYIKNLPKTVTLENLQYLFGRYFEDEDQMKQELKVRLMDGRLKGQAFATFPSTESAARALEDVHGYVYQEKPIIIQFAEEEKKDNKK